MNEERKSDLKQTEDRQSCLKHHMAGNFNRCTQSTYLEICVYGGKQKNMSHRITASACEQSCFPLFNEANNNL